MAWTNETICCKRGVSSGMKKQDHTRPIDRKGNDPDMKTLFDNRYCNAVPFFRIV